MGEYADMILEGDTCPCGEYLGDGPGYPQYYSEQCARDYGDAGFVESKPAAQAWKCPYCKKKLKSAQGVDDHVRAKHADKIGRAS